MNEWQIVLDKLEEMGSDIKELKTDMREVKSRLDKLEQRMDKLEQKQETIFDQTAGLNEFRQTTEKTLKQILEQQISIVHIIGEHNVAIQTLQRKVG